MYQAAHMRTACSYASQPGPFPTPSPALALESWALLLVQPLMNYGPGTSYWTLSLNFFTLQLHRVIEEIKGKHIWRLPGT